MLCIVLVRYWYCEERKYSCFSERIKMTIDSCCTGHFEALEIARGERILGFWSWIYLRRENQKVEIDALSRSGQKAMPRSISAGHNVRLRKAYTGGEVGQVSCLGCFMSIVARLAFQVHHVEKPQSTCTSSREISRIIDLQTTNNWSVAPARYTSPTCM